jgi:hypothetical protein
MRTMNERLHDELTAHFMLALNYVAYLQRKYSGIVFSHNEALRELLSSHLSSLKSRNMRTVQWQKFDKKLSDLRKDMMAEISSNLASETTAFRKKELAYVVGLMDEITPVMYKWNVPELKPKADSVIFGMTIAERMNTITQSDVRRISLKVKSLFSAQRSSSDIINAVLGLASLNYVGSVVNQTSSFLRSNVQTIISGLSEEALHAFSRANPNVIQYEVFVAILDSKTTVQCADADGEFWTVDEGLFPPLHENCRSRRYPLINGQAFVDGRFFYMKDGEGYTRMTLTGDQKVAWVAKYVGDIPRNFNYEEFLKRQPLSFQERVLGKTKAQLFRSGKLELSQFIDSSGRTLTLDQLYSLYGKSFLTTNLQNIA